MRSLSRSTQATAARAATHDRGNERKAMSRKPETKRAIAEASVTLPEGAVVSVSKYDKYTEVHATRCDKELRMRVDNISAQMVGTYLMLLCREIAKRRLLITEKPVYVPFSPKPKNLDEFVKHMAVQDMFIFEAITPVIESDANEAARKENKATRRRLKKEDKSKAKGVDLELINEVFPNAAESE